MRHINPYGILTYKRIIRLYYNQEKREIVDFALRTDHWEKFKENEKKDQYLDLSRELKKLWNMKVTIIPIVFGAFGEVTKGLLKGLEYVEIRGPEETIQTTTLLRTVRILRRVRIVDFAFPADNIVKIKDNNKIDKYLEFTRELRTLWMKRLTVIIVIGALWTVPKDMENGLKEY